MAYYGKSKRVFCEDLSMNLVRFINSFGYAMAGLRYAFGTQQNLRIHVVVGTVVIGLGVVVLRSFLEWAVLLLTIGMVLISELINTAVEATVDLLSPEYASSAKIAKDVSAAAVFMAALVSIVVGSCLFMPHLGGLWMFLGKRLGL